MFGRKDITRFRRRATGSVFGGLAVSWRLIAGNRPARWIARIRAFRVAVALLIFAYVFFGRYVWSPVRRMIRRARKYLGRHEVWYHVIAWGTCGVIGYLLTITWWQISDLAIKMLLGAMAATAFALISFRSPSTALLGYLVCYPLLRSLFYFKVMEGLPMFTTDSVGMLILLLVYLVHPKREVAPAPTRALHWFMALFMIGMVIATLRTDAPKRQLQAVLQQYGIPILIYFFARRWVGDIKRLRACFLMLLLIGVYFMVFAIPEHFTGRNYFSSTGWSAYWEPELGTVRAQGPASSPQEFGLTLTLVYFVGLIRLTHAPARRKWVFVLLCIACVVAIAFSLRRSVYLGYGLGLLVMFAATPRVRRNTAITVCCCILAIAIGWKGLKTSVVYTERITQAGPVLARAVTNATALNIAKNHPWFGLGYDKFGEGTRRYLVGYGNIMPWYGRGFVDPHSSYWTIMVGGGLLAFAPFCCLIFMMFHTGYRIYKRVRGPGLLGRDGIVAFWAYTLGVLSQAATTNSFFHDRYIIVLMYFYLGALVGTHLREAKAEEPVAQPVEPVPRRISRRLARA